ncbi:MAG TPA: alpha-amylase family glycosyl hydrolase [Opitutaceae bacterium]|nr:alpha-amylase family glycosyl hydrolase [Opitutaceae bacterium]
MKPLRAFLTSVAALALLALPGRSAETPVVCSTQTAVGQPDWVRHAVIYEINVRQFSASGTFDGVTEALPRLHALGVDTLWLMPINPIGEVNRKGPLGSYYAVRDYMAVNPEFGTEADFRRLVEAAHAQGFRIILDWVGNHTAWDNPLAKEHPDYYVHDAKGAFVPPVGTDWTDVIQLDFSNPGVLDYEARAMAHWVRDFGVDGFRCDFATGLPTTLWDKLTARLRAIRPDLFFLAESELPQEQLKAFNASYAFDMMQTFNEVAQGRAGVSHIDDTLARIGAFFPRGAALMFYTSNHDENTWAGTEFERLGGGAAPFAVLSFALNGIPLIYNGQEIGLDRRLEFFQRDPIAWHPDPRTKFYRTLCDLRRTDPALWTGASMRRLPSTHDESLYVVLREAAGHRVAACLNLTARDLADDTYVPALAGTWRDAFTGETVTFTADTKFALHAWQYRVLVGE